MPEPIDDPAELARLGVTPEELARVHRTKACLAEPEAYLRAEDEAAGIERCDDHFD